MATLNERLEQLVRILGVERSRAILDEVIVFGTGLDVLIMCDECKQEVDEIRHVRRDGVKQCSDCFLAENGPQL